jgi:hypothetical protein
MPEEQRMSHASKRQSLNTASSIPVIAGTRLRFAICVAAASTLGLLPAWFGGALLAADEKPDLTGLWQLDKGLSEDPMEMRPERQLGGRRGGRAGGIGGGPAGGGWGGSPGGVGGSRPGGMGAPAGGIAGRGRGSGASRDEMLQRMKKLQESLEQIEITQGESSLEIVFADGRKQTLTTNNKKNMVETPLGEAEIKARWRDGSLVVKTKVDRRMTIETYHLATGGELLTVVVEATSEGPRPLSYKRIYRPALAKADAED